MNNNIISLQETAADFWVAKYQGNYGQYTIKIKVDGSKNSFFSCTCPSDGYPCKHIGMIRSAIDERKNDESYNSQQKTNEITIKDILERVSEKELRKFIIDYARYNEELSKKIQLTFLSKVVNKEAKTLNIILKSELDKIHFDMEELYSEYDDCPEIDILDEWLNLATEHSHKKEFEEAIDIAKACLEEYAAWKENIEDEVLEYLNPDYIQLPFEIFKSASLEDIKLADELFEYCYKEHIKEKYADTELFDEFQDFMAAVAKTEQQKKKFIELQEDLLEDIDDKNSKSTEDIITRVINFYQIHNQHEQANELMEDNLQFFKFRKLILEDKIKAKEFDKAKKLINEAFTITDNQSHIRQLEELLLSIGQMENDLPTIRSICFKFIERNYYDNYFGIYRNTFTKEEWMKQKEILINNYQNTNKGFVDSIAKVLVAEKESERLFQYVAKYFSLSKLEEYHIYFHKQFPFETLQLFQKAIIKYANDNTGRGQYEYIVQLFNKMCKIQDGEVMARMISNQFKLTYKTRRAMLEILYKAGY